MTDYIYLSNVLLYTLYIYIQINLDKLRKEKQLAEQILKEIKYDCNKSINKYRALKHKNIVLKSRIVI